MGLGYKPNHFLNSESREMDMALRRVLDITTVMNSLFGSQGTIVEITFNNMYCTGL